MTRPLFVEPGALRVELTLQDCVRADDGLGGFTESWADAGLVFARIEPVRADSRFAAAQTLEDATHRITLRWRAGVKSGMRFAKGARVFDIMTVHDPDDSGRYLVCRVKEQGL